MDPAGVNQAITLVQAVIKLGKRATNLQYEEALLAAREAIFELREENINLKENSKILENNLKNKVDYILEKGVHWEKDDKVKDQPFCPVCYSKGKIVPLKKSWDGRDKQHSTWQCPDTKCNAAFNPWDYKEPDPEPRDWIAI